MKTIGIVTEFNPFHDGHKYLIDNARKNLDADFVIAIMSGNFMQRGYPALFDKWQRAERAVESSFRASACIFVRQCRAVCIWWS